jgi:hypothetical protein
MPLGTSHRKCVTAQELSTTQIHVVMGLTSLVAIALGQEHCGGSKHALQMHSQVSLCWLDACNHDDHRRVQILKYNHAPNGHDGYVCALDRNTSYNLLI